MEGDQHQASSVKKTLQRMNVTLEEETNVFTILEQLITASSKHTTKHGSTAVNRGAKLAKEAQFLGIFTKIY